MIWCRNVFSSDSGTPAERLRELEERGTRRAASPPSVRDPGCPRDRIRSRIHARRSRIDCERGAARETAARALRLACVQLAQQMDQHQRALAFEQVAADLLAVAPLVAREVEQIVLNLKRRAEVAAEAIEAIEIDAVASSR